MGRLEALLTIGEERRPLMPRNADSWRRECIGDSMRDLLRFSSGIDVIYPRSDIDNRECQSRESE
jgi:hypothetical protein